MTTETIKQILDNHSVANRTENGRILADSMIAHEPLSWIDVTGWTRGELLLWLGY
jgi:hypothetical protein